MKKISISLLVVLTLVSCTTTSKLDRSKVPAAGPAPVINIGTYETFTLDNGLKVIVVENNKLPRVSYQLSLNIDPLLEKDKAGYSGMAGDLLSAGTVERTKAQIDEEIDFVGGSFSTYSEGIYAGGLKKHADKILEIMSDVLLNPSFPEEELEKLRKQSLSSLASAKTSPAAMSQNIARAMRYGTDHPYGEVQTEKTVTNITRADVMDYYDKYFRPNAAYLVIVGDITRAEAEAQAKKYFGSWKKRTVPAHSYALPQMPNAQRVVFVPLKNAVQSDINITHPALLKPGSEDLVAARVMNSILGGGVFSGRLMQNLREDKGYTYGARSSLNDDKLIGYFSASASVRNNVTDSAIVQFMYEIERMTNELVPDSTLDFTKNGMNGSFARSLEDPQTIAGFALDIERYNLPKDYYANYLSRLQAVTKEDVMAAAKKYLHPKFAYITVVGNKDEVGDKLAQFAKSGKVEYFDQYGQPWSDMKPAPEGTTAQTVLDRYLQSIGGKAKLEKIKTTHQKGSFTMGPMALSMEIKTKDNKKLNMSVGQGGMVMIQQVCDGTAGFQSQMGQKADLTPEELIAIKMQADLLWESRIADYGQSVVLLGMAEALGQQAYVLEFTEADKTKRTEYFSTESGLRLRTEKTVETPGGPMTQTTDMVEYKQFEGISFAVKMAQSAGGQNFDITIDEVILNTGVKDDAFEIK